MVAALNGLLVQWRDPSFSVAAAFLVAPSEQEAKDWYRALRDLPDHPPPPRTTQPK